MIKVALTGNIGSGKSTVAQIFSVFGVPVFKADIEARKLYSEQAVKDIMISMFTDKILSTSGDIDSKILASIIFNDKKALKAVNNIIHPLVFDKYNSWCENYKDEHYTIHEAAIIFENKLQGKYDVVINVSAPIEIRVERVMERDKISEELVRQRMANQLIDEIKCKLSQFVVYNDGNSFLIPQVNSIHNSLLSTPAR